jgi:hypothetical protein
MFCFFHLPHRNALYLRSFHGETPRRGRNRHSGSAVNPCFARFVIKAGTVTTREICGKFKDNSHGWNTGEVRNSSIAGNRSIRNGLHTWNMSAVQSTSDFSFPVMDDQLDFYAGVNIKVYAMPIALMPTPGWGSVIPAWIKPGVTFLIND